MRKDALTEKIRRELHRLQDTKYRDLQIQIIPSVKPESIIGVRTPELRKMAKTLAGEEGTGSFLEDLPHRYFEENQLQAFIISGMKDYTACLAELERFLPYVDNWATCDQMSPRVFRKHRPELLKSIDRWIASGETYTVRFGIGMLMEHYLDEDFDPAYPEKAAAVRSEEYYVNMMIAWYFATALAKQYDAVLPFIEERRLDPWTHNKAIRKAVESFRITPEQKEYLKTLKIRRTKD
ncbi:MAG: DNA alkylation repair protein [Clostridiales bacterium]|nr:DNA alkylation repair protein [Clostridia bacterium]MCR5565929.1 DNA alkylation repair protein [Clostridiales bacterium]